MTWLFTQHQQKNRQPWIKPTSQETRNQKLFPVIIFRERNMWSDWSTEATINTESWPNSGWRDTDHITHWPVGLLKHETSKTRKTSSRWGKWSSPFYWNHQKLLWMDNNNKTTVELHTAKLLGKKSIPESITLGSICQEELKLTHKHKPKSYTLTSYLEQKKHAWNRKKENV